jgi:hypothetical protein
MNGSRPGGRTLKPGLRQGTSFKYLAALLGVRSRDPEGVVALFENDACVVEQPQRVGVRRAKDGLREGYERATRENLASSMACHWAVYFSEDCGSGRGSFASKNPRCWCYCVANPAPQ